jgi:hypothetical protein
VLTTDQARVLIESIDTSTLVGLRDRALIGVMTYAFARIGAVVSMQVEDSFAHGKRYEILRTTSSKPSSMNTFVPPVSPATKGAPCSARPCAAPARSRPRRCTGSTFGA